MSIVPSSVESFGLSQALVDEVEVPLRCGDAALRFLLKSVQNNIDRFGIADLADVAPDLARELSQVSPARTDPSDLALRSTRRQLLPPASSGPEFCEVENPLIRKVRE